MMSRIWLSAALLCLCPLSLRAGEPVKKWWSDEAMDGILATAKGNRGELEAALDKVPNDQRKGMRFIIVNMPAVDLLALKADFLLTNSEFAYKARQETPWGKNIPEGLFFNNVLAYANVDEKRDPWRKEFFEMCMPIVKDCKTAAQAAHKINSELFRKIGLRYAPQKRAPNLSPKESMAQGLASCTGLSIVLSDACRSVGVPARLVGTPNWSDKRGNHTWVEIWDHDWHFTGACEADNQGLDRGWFVNDASRAQKDSLEHAIYAASYEKTGQHFPLVWARDKKTVPSENVTDRYTKKAVKSDMFRLSIRVFDGAKNRIAVPVTVTAASDPQAKFDGKSRDETVDLNDFLTFELRPEQSYVVAAGADMRTITAGKAGEQRTIDFVTPAK